MEQFNRFLREGLYAERMFHESVFLRCLCHLYKYQLLHFRIIPEGLKTEKAPIINSVLQDCKVKSGNEPKQLEYHKIFASPWAASLELVRRLAFSKTLFKLKKIES